MNFIYYGVYDRSLFDETIYYIVAYHVYEVMKD
jgi:hypothetical protein